SNTTQYYRQEQVVQMQESMRFALEYLKNDLRNAGRLAVTNGFSALNTERDPKFCQLRQDLRGVELFEEDANTPRVLTALGNGLQPDRLRLLVDATPVTMSVARGSGDRLRLAESDRQPTQEARDLARSRARFEAAFRPGHYLFVTKSPGFVDLVPISDSSFDAGGSTIELNDVLCPGMAAFSSCGGDCMVAPVQLIEYRVRENDDDPLRTELVRQVIDARDGQTVVDDLSLTLAEYVIDLQFWATYAVRNPFAPAPTLPEDVDPTDDVGNLDVPSESDAINARPQDVRMLTVLMAVRTPREDPEFTVALGQRDAPPDRVAADRTWFEVDDAVGSGFARVATLRAEVETINLVRGM
ncbi:MAG: hypothetical protein KC620_20670, partial [Myxococcales bacterium]|nr:hypothetical protein [Myxococcales bacterium]